MNRSAVQILFGSTIFVGAFLLFQVQPILGKYILPWFGGTPAVWTTCMLFFQVALLFGYAYAHALIRYVPRNRQAVVHLILLAAALVPPIVPGASWAPVDPDRPVSRILAMLLVSVGLPYFVLASTGPLLQAWFTRVNPDRSAYRLYALSNIASMLALLSYPFVVEPYFTRSMQAIAWRVSLVVFAILCGSVSILASRRREAGIIPDAQLAQSPPPTLGRLVLWLVLPAAASAMLLAVTNKICQDIAVIPLLFIVPLAIYLLTFIISFDSPRWYRREIFMPLLGIAMALTCVALFQKEDVFGLFLLIGVYCLMLFAACMVCHGELYRLRPDATRLTSFYLMISLGGAVGGAIIAIGAPLLLKGYVELHFILFAVALLAMICLYPAIYRRHPGLYAAIGVLVLTLGGVLWFSANRVLKDASVLERKRNFYGVLTVYSMHSSDPMFNHRILQHGGVTHGVQFSNLTRRGHPTAYYGPGSGIGLLFQSLKRASPLKVGAIGLGVGTVAAYGEDGDEFHFYEINDDVRICAYAWFAYLNDSHAKCTITIGDGRLSLDRELPQNYDVMILDAFSGDAIPVHLLTKECFDIYQRQLKPNGVIAIHISNQSLNLAPVVQRAAERFGYQSVYIASQKRPEWAEYDARWMLLTKDDQLLNSDPIRQAASPIPDIPSVRLWTDDDTNLFQILSRSSIE